MSYISPPPIKINPPHHGWIGGWRQRGGVGRKYRLLMIFSRLLQKTCQLWLKSCTPARLTSLASARTLNHSELFRWDFEKNVWKHTHADEINICGVDVVRGLKNRNLGRSRAKKPERSSSLIDRKTIEDVCEVDSQKILTEQVNESRSGENKRSSDRSQAIWRMAGDESICSERARPDYAAFPFFLLISQSCKQTCTTLFTKPMRAAISSFFF